jgi:hypothetical protein
VEFLIVFLPVFTMFLCLLQLALLFAVRLVVGHAAVSAARAAAVVIGDDPETYGEMGKIPRHDLASGNGERPKAIYQAAILSLAPFIVDGTISEVSVRWPPPDKPYGKAQKKPSFAPINMGSISKLRIRLEVVAACRIAIANRIACDGWAFPTKNVKAEAIYPYQGARYEYPR